MSNTQSIQLPRDLNGDLCAFSNRWIIDGDYMRCRKCKRPQITNYMNAEFPHADKCKAAGVVEPHPWRAYLGLISRLTLAATGGKGDNHG